jgi:hypothetical protein
MPPGHPCTAVGVAAAALLLGAGCGSQDVADLPPPAGPAASPPLEDEPAGQVARGLLGRGAPPARRLRATAEGGLRATLDPRARTLTVTKGAETTTIAAGVGPTAVVSQADRFYVVDAMGDGLLVVQTQPEPRVTRRVALPGGPYAAATHSARRELYVTLTASNEVVQLPAHGRPFVRRTFPTVRAPREVVAGGPSGGVLVRGTDATQVLSPADLDGEQQG